MRQRDPLLDEEAEGLPGRPLPAQVRARDVPLALGIEEQREEGGVWVEALEEAPGEDGEELLVQAVVAQGGGRVA